MGAAFSFVPSADAIGLFLDVDGTLLDLAPTPDAVVVSPILIEELALAERRLEGALALVSGRPIGELDRLFAPLRLRASGVHGAEIRYAPLEPAILLTKERLPETAWTDLVQAIAGFPGVFAENKRVSFAVHYGQAKPLAPQLLVALKRYVEQRPAHGLEIVRGHFVYEVKLPGFDKGSAIKQFMARPPFAGRRPVFIADDKMDWPGFRAALALGGEAFSVGGEIAGLSGSFARPEAVRKWLGKVAA